MKTVEKKLKRKLNIIVKNYRVMIKQIAAIFIMAVLIVSCNGNSIQLNSQGNNGQVSDDKEAMSGHDLSESGYLYLGDYQLDQALQGITEGMESALLAYAQNVTLEKQFFSSGIKGLEKGINSEYVDGLENGISDYDEFNHALLKSYDDIERDFSSYHLQLIDYSKELKESQAKTNDQGLYQLLVSYEKNMASLFQEFLDYHYMVLKVDLTMHAFDENMKAMMNFMSQGQVTSNEYNHELELLMDRQKGLLNMNLMSEESVAFLANEEDVVHILTLTTSAKKDVLSLETFTDADQEMNGFVYNMFDYIDVAVTVMHDYQKTAQGNDFYQGNLRLDLDPLEYAKEAIKDIRS